MEEKIQDILPTIKYGALSLFSAILAQITYYEDVDISLQVIATGISIMIGIIAYLRWRKDSKISDIKFKKEKMELEIKQLELENLKKASRDLNGKQNLN